MVVDNESLVFVANSSSPFVQVGTPGLKGSVYAPGLGVTFHSATPLIWLITDANANPVSQCTVVM